MCAAGVGVFGSYLKGAERPGDLDIIVGRVSLHPADDVGWLKEKGEPMELVFGREGDGYEKV